MLVLSKKLLSVRVIKKSNMRSSALKILENMMICHQQRMIFSSAAVIYKHKHVPFPLISTVEYSVLIEKRKGKDRFYHYWNNFIIKEGRDNEKKNE